MSSDPSVPSSIRRFVTGDSPAMLIDGAHVPAVSGETFETVNPATGKLLARLPAADAPDATAPSRLPDAPSTMGRGRP